MLLFATALLILFADQATKAYIRHAMAVGDSIPVIPGALHVTHVKNTGAAFGLFQNQQIMFLVVSVAVIILVLYSYRHLAPQSRASGVSLGLLLGGTTGNLIDRAVFGKVTDFVDLRVWPVFNVADSAIVVGIAAFGYLLLVSSREERAGAEGGEPAESGTDLTIKDG